MVRFEYSKNDLFRFGMVGKTGSQKEYERKGYCRRLADSRTGNEVFPEQLMMPLLMIM